jgi:WD40 repeat protein
MPRVIHFFSNLRSQVFEGHTDSVCSIVFSLDGKQVVSASCDHTAQLWDTATGALQQTLEGHTDIVFSIVFSLDGKQVVSGCGDGIVRVWDTATGTLQQILEGHISPV